MKKNIKILYVISLLQGMVFYASISTLYRTSAGISLFELGIIEAISYLLTMLFEIPWGILADRIGYKKTMVVCGWIYLLSKVVFWKADSFAAFILERILLSVAISGYSGVDTSMLYLSCDQQDSQKVFSNYYNFGNAGIIISSLMFSLFFKNDYRMAALVTCIPYLIAAVLGFFLKEVKHELSTNSLKKQYEMIKLTLCDKNTVLFLVGAGLFLETTREIAVFLNQLIYIGAGLHEGWIGMIYIVMSFVGFFSAYSSYFTKKMGRIGFILLLAIGSIAACLILIVTRTPLFCIFGIMMIEIANTMFYPLFTTLQNERVKVADRATQLSVYMIITDVVGLIADMSIFTAADHSLSSAIFLSLTLCGAGGILVLKNLTMKSETQQCG